MRLAGLLLLLFIASLNATKMSLWESDKLNHSNYIEIMNEKRRIPSWMLIFPGTKWCGAGSLASTYDDLGKERSADICCRAHDNCPDIIKGKETKYNLMNTAFYTKLNCECDVAFHSCLKTANTATSRSVGVIYFTLLETQCFKEEYPIIKCNKFQFFPWKKCIEYEVDDTKSKVYQWFDLPNF